MTSQKSCHNCRQKRLRCDHSVPVCHKCLSTGQECLGYGKFYSWINAVASRGKFSGKKTFAPSSSRKKKSEAPHLPNGHTLTNVVGQPTIITLIDPLFQDLDYSCRHYLSYFATRFCQDLIINGSYQLHDNPFRELIPLSSTYPFLQHIIVAVSALHYSNIVCNSVLSHQYYPQRKTDALVDALRSRHNAIKALQATLAKASLLGEDGVSFEEKDALLATILFFVNFTLIDTGKDGWRPHMKAAAKLMAAQSSRSFDLLGHCQRAPASMSIGQAKEFPISSVEFPRPPVPHLYGRVTVKDYIASDSVVYHILGSTIDTLALSDGKSSLCANINADDILSILTRTELNSYHGCPAALLLIIFRTSRLAQEVSSPSAQQMNAFVDLLTEAQSFDVDGWVAKVYAVSGESGDHDEHESRFRTHMVASYRAAACLYILLAVPGLQRHLHHLILSTSAADGVPFLPKTEDFITTIINELSLIPVSTPLYKYTTWPLFMSGMETTCPERRKWVISRMEIIWDLCPWGMIKSAMEVLTNIWRLRDGTKISKLEKQDEDDQSWLSRLRGIEIDCLIV